MRRRPRSMVIGSQGLVAGGLGILIVVLAVLGGVTLRTSRTTGAVELGIALLLVPVVFLLVRHTNGIDPQGATLRPRATARFGEPPSNVRLINSREGRPAPPTGTSVA